MCIHSSLSIILAHNGDLYPLSGPPVRTGRQRGRQCSRIAAEVIYHQNVAVIRDGLVKNLTMYDEKQSHPG